VPKPVRIVLPVLLLLVLAAGAGWWWQNHDEPADPDRLILYGNVDVREVRLAFNGAERIARMLVEEGEQVEAGQLLAVLDSERLQARVDQAAAQVAAQQQVVAALEAGTRPEEINRARAELELTEAQNQDAQRSLARIQDLARRQLASPQQVDDAAAAAESAAARVKAAQATLDLALAGPREEDIAAARANQQALEAQLALARRELADAELHAPRAGVIRNRILEPGDMASPQQPVYTLALTDPIRIRAYVDEPDLGKLRPGMAARIATDSFPDKTYRGWLGYISPTAEFTPKSVQTTEVRTSLVYQVQVHVCNPNDEMRLGMPATVTLVLDRTEPSTGRCDDGPPTGPEA
jgi:HlyD family secretion protein